MVCSGTDVQSDIHGAGCAEATAAQAAFTA